MLQNPTENHRAAWKRAGGISQGSPALNTLVEENPKAHELDTDYKTMLQGQESNSISVWYFFLFFNNISQKYLPENKENSKNTQDSNINIYGGY